MELSLFFRSRLKKTIIKSIFIEDFEKVRIGRVNKQIRDQFIERAIPKENIVNLRLFGPVSENPETIRVSDIPVKYRSNRTIRNRIFKGIRI